MYEWFSVERGRERIEREQAKKGENRVREVQEREEWVYDVCKGRETSESGRGKNRVREGKNGCMLCGRKGGRENRRSKGRD